MYGVDGDDASLAQGRQSIDDDLAARSKGDGAIQLDRGPRVFVAHPDGAPLLGRATMRCAPRDYVDPAVPSAQNIDGERGRAAEAVEAHAFPAFDAGDPQAAESNGSRAKQRGDRYRLDIGGEGNCKIAAHRGKFGISSVDGISGKNRPVAEILHA